MVRSAGILVLLFGTTVTVIGAFAPWVRSGSTTRNSFQLAGTAERFGLLEHPVLRALVDNWGLIGPVLMIPLILAGIRWWRACSLVAVVIGIGVAALTATVMIAAGDRRILTIELLNAGPVTMIAGGVLIASSGCLLLLSRHRDSALRW